MNYTSAFSQDTITQNCELMLSDVSIASTYTLKNGKVCQIKKDGDDKQFLQLCDPFEVIGRSYDEAGANSSLIIRFLADRASKDVVEVQILVSELVADPKKVVAELAGKGLWVSARRDHILRIGELLSLVRPANDIVTANYPGWHDDAFVSPTGEVFGEQSTEYRLKDGMRFSDPESAGDLEAWQGAVKAAIDCENGDFLCVGLLSGFAGPIVDLLQEGSSVLINFAGTTSRGKTTAQRLGASVWGNPVRGAALVQFNVTPGAIEAIAERASGTLLAIDEGGQNNMTGAQYQSAVFNLAEGSGKRRLTPSATERRVRRWSTCITISEEIGFADKVKRDGRNAAAGAVARLWEIDVDDAKILSDSTLVEIEGIKHSYGHAGPIFIEHLISSGYGSDPNALRKRVKEKEKTLSTKGDSPQKRRVTGAAAVILVAGELAIEAGLLPHAYDLQGAITRVLERSFDRMARDMDPLDVALSNLREGVLSRVGYDVLDIDYEQGAIFREVASQYGYLIPPDKFVSDEKPHESDKEFTPDERIYFIPVEQMAAFGGGNVTAKAIARALKKQGYLFTPDAKNSIWPTMPRGQKIKHYRVSGGFFHDLTKVASDAFSSEAP